MLPADRPPASEAEPRRRPLAEVVTLPPPTTPRPLPLCGDRPRPLPRSRRWLSWLLFFLVVLPYFRSEVMTSYDSGYSLHLALSLLHEGDLDLDEYRELIPEDDYRVMRHEDHLLSRYPVAPSIFILPLLMPLRSAMNQGLHLRVEWLVREGRAAGLEKLLASILMAFTAILIFHLARLELSDGASMLVALVFAFCTSAWSVVSRGLWQHGPSIFLLTVALYILLRARDRARLVPYAALPLVGAYAMRPTNAIPLLLLTLYVAWRYRRWLWHYLAYGAAVGAAFLAVNLWTYGTILPWYFRPHGGQWRLGGDFLEAATGLLVSPGRGLFVYSSIFLLSLVGMALLWRQRRWGLLETTLAAWLFGHWLLISTWFNWWGGGSFGPRMLADTIPVWIYFLLPVVAALRTPGRKRWLLAGALVLTVTASFLIHRTGARNMAAWSWNQEPTSIETTPARLWDWRDPPFRRSRRD